MKLVADPAKADPGVAAGGRLIAGGGGDEVGAGRAGRPGEGRGESQGELAAAEGLVDGDAGDLTETAPPPEYVPAPTKRPVAASMVVATKPPTATIRESAAPSGTAGSA